MDNKIQDFHKAWENTTRIEQDDEKVFNIRTSITNANIENETSRIGAYEKYQNVLTDNAAMLLNLSDQEEDWGYVARFSCRPFLSTLWIHLSHQFFGPFSCLINLWIFKKSLLTNMSMLPNRVTYFADLLFFVYFVMCFIMFYLYNDVFVQYIGSIIATGMVIMLRHIMCSLKYGAWPAKLFERFYNHDCGFQTFYPTTAIAGWAKVPQLTIVLEYKRMLFNEKDNKKMLFRCTGQISQKCQNDFKFYWESLSDQKKFDPNTEIPLISYTSLLIQKVSETFSKSIFIFMLFFAISYSWFTLLVRYYEYGLQGFRNDSFEITFTCLSFFLSFSESFRFFAYVSVGIYDFDRKLKFMALCSYMISNHTYGQCEFFKENPKIDMLDSETIQSWYRMRRVFLNFGYHFTKRIFMYASLIIIICIVLMIVLILQLLRQIPTYANSYIANWFFLFTVTLLILLRICFQAVWLNFYYEIHIEKLIEIKRHVTLALHKSETKNQKLKEARQSLSVIIAQLNQDMKVRPIKILGVKMDFSFAAKMLGVAASTLAAIISILIRDV